jgi:hypothetical protein
MGWNTSMIILNDAVDAIGKDKEFGQKVHDAVLRCGSRNKQINIPSGPNINAATIIESHHADSSVLLAVGGNCASVLTSVFDFRHNTEETQVKLLRELADKLGYTISRKRSKKIG